MLQGLGKNLRRCGIDTAVLENNCDHKDCVKYAMDDNRYIVTKKGTFKMVFVNSIHTSSFYYIVIFS